MTYTTAWRWLTTSYSVAQVKEKFGGLRYYFDVPEGVSGEVWREMNRAVDEAEKKSFVTCETCGQPGSLRSRGGWYYTSCDDHAKQD